MPSQTQLGTQIPFRSTTIQRQRRTYTDTTVYCLTGQ